MNRKPEYLKEGEEPERVYYGNVCDICFSKCNLSRCNACERVQYCCELHKQEDLAFHSKICPILESCKFPKGIDTKDFFFRRWDLLISVKKHREPNILTQYDKEICLLPCVCIICFTSNNLNFGCEQCGSVAYCSMDHKKQDEVKHKVICTKLHLCRIFSSLGYKFGCKVKPINFKYQPIREKERRFPKEMKELLKILQKQVRNPTDDNQAINTGAFTDRYCAAATILSCLESIGVINNRKYNWLPNKKLYQVVDFKPRSRNSNAKMSANFVIHMVAASDYEVHIPWANFVGLILDWLKNVHYIKIILVGRDLKEFKGFDFENIKHNACYEFHPCMYKDVVDQLEPPDVIIMHNFGYPNMDGVDEFLNHNHRESLFKYSQVPVIVTSAFPLFLGQITNSIKRLENVQLVSDIAMNMFCDCQSVRFWGNAELQCNHLNEFLAIFRKK